MAGGGLGLLERALVEHACEGSNRRVRVVSWDQSLVKLTVAPRCRIPPGIEDRWGQAVHRANCGLLALIRHAWVSVDSMLYIWDYCEENSPVLTYTADSAIITVTVCQPQPDVLPEDSWLLLVVATRRSVSLVGIEPKPGQRPRICLETLPRYEVATDGAIFHSIRCNLSGHIFLLCGAPQVYELVYTAEPGWFGSHAQLVRHSVRWWPWLRDFVSVSPQTSCRITQLECAAHDYVVTVDDTSSIRLLRSFSHSGAVILEELSFLSATKMDQRITELMQTSLASCVVDHISFAIGLDGHLHLHVLTAACDRLHFLCSASLPQGPPCIGVVVPPASFSVPYTQTAAEADKQCFGFWLKEFVQGTTSSQSALFQSPIIRSACMELSSDPCICSTGICLRAARQPSCAAATDIGISVCTEDHSNGVVGGARLELQTILPLTYPILDICEDYPGVSCEPALEGDAGAMYRDRAFAVLLQDGVKIIRISHQPWDSDRAPATPKECCSHLLQLDSMKSSRMSGSCEWMWSLDDARAPSFDAQQQHLSVARTIPPMSLGRWFCGLLHCLAIILRPIWNARLVQATAAFSRPLWSFYKRRKVASHCFTFAEASLEHTHTQLKLVLKFVSRGSGVQPLGGRPSAPSAPSSVAARSRMYADPKSDTSHIPGSVMQLLADVLDVAGRLEQILGLLRVIRHYARTVLQSPALPADVLSTLLQHPCNEFVASAEGLQPFVRLCAAALSVVDAKDVTQAKTGMADMCKDLQEMCPLIFAQVDLNQYSTASPSQPRSVEVGAVAIGEALWASSLDMPAAYWDAIMRGVEEASPDIAQKMCTSKLQQLSETPGDPEAIAARVLQLVSAFLRAVSRHHISNSRVALTTLVSRTHGFRFAPAASREATPSAAAALLEDARAAKLPFVHAAVLECLIEAVEAEGGGAVGSTSGASSLLDDILASKYIDMEGFLLRRYTSKKMAAEYFARYYLESHPARAKDVLLLLAEWPDSSCRLDERLRALERAMDLVFAHCQSEWAKQASADINRKLQVARRVQVPLLSDLKQIAANSRLDVSVSSDARSRLEEVEQLLDLEVLHDIAVHFGLYHILLMIADLSEGAHAREDISEFWISLFCPPRSCAYCLPPTNFGTEEGAASLASKFFPLLMVRKGLFFASQASSSAQHSVISSDCLRLRSLSFLEELVRFTQVRDSPSSLWDARCIAAVLEYSNCAWLAALEAYKVEGPRCRSWVALDVLHCEPFSASLVEIVRFYRKMLESSQTWVRDLQAKLPEGCNWDLQDEDDLQVHLSEVVLAVIDRWIREVIAPRPPNRHDDQALAISEFREDWRRNGEGLLAGLALRLNGLLSHHSSAKRLLQEVSRLEADVRKVLG